MNASAIGAIVAAIIAAAAPIAVYRLNRRTATTDAAQRQIDQIQEDREDDRKQFETAKTRLEARQERLEQRLERMESRERQFSDYVLQLRWHISENLPPPPPVFPPGLLAPFDDHHRHD